MQVLSETCLPIDSSNSRSILFGKSGLFFPCFCHALDFFYTWSYFWLPRNKWWGKEFEASFRKYRNYVDNEYQHSDVLLALEIKSCSKTKDGFHKLINANSVIPIFSQELVFPRIHVGRERNMQGLKLTLTWANAKKMTTKWKEMCKRRISAHPFEGGRD